jgi:hypothetical protein
MNYPPEVMEVLGHHAAMVHVAAQKIAAQQNRSYHEALLEIVTEGERTFERMSPQQLQVITGGLLEALRKVREK